MRKKQEIYIVEYKLNSKNYDNSRTTNTYR